MRRREAQASRRKVPDGWLLFFYSVPSRPVSNRMKVWRRLTKAGALQLKGSVYILPFTDAHYEFLQWLVSQIAEMKGEAAFARITAIDTMKDSEILTLFDRQRTDDYKAVEKALDDFERRLNNVRKGAKARDVKGFLEQFNRILKDFEDVKRIDFFSSKKGKRLIGAIKHLKAAVQTLSGAEPDKEKPAPILPRRLRDYQGKTWITRKKPFIDRMASAWLIKRFIDRKASFAFIEERDMDARGKVSIPFDIRRGEFTHTGDMCTFEVLVKAFGLKDKALREIAEIVHNLDVKDDKYRTAEAGGLEDILTGISRTAKGDADALLEGMQVFEMLYASRR